MIPHRQTTAIESGPYYEFRERSVIEVAREALRLLWRHLPALVAPAVLIILAFTLLADGLVASLDVNWNDPQQAARARALVQLVLSVGNFLAMPAVIVALGVICAGRRPGFEETLVGGLRAVPRLVWTTLVGLPALVLGLFLFVFPAIYLGIVWYLMSVAVVLEGLSGSRALSRSFHLMEGHMWRGAGVLACGFVVFVPMALLTQVVAAWVPSIGSVLVAGEAALTIAFGQVLAVLLYLDIRVREEQPASIRSCARAPAGSIPASAGLPAGA